MPGPFGYLSPCYWIADRVIIDPLVDEYRRLQLEINNSTLFTSDIATYALPAEQQIDELVGAVTGVIVCRNALDHCEDPLAVLELISRYAAGGCYLLMWTDIWHLSGLDEGHRNITKSEAAMTGVLQGLGFTILRKCRKIRDPTHCIEYGCIARKVTS
jgi:hypothetical protein